MIANNLILSKNHPVFVGRQFKTSSRVHYCIHAVLFIYFLKLMFIILL